MAHSSPAERRDGPPKILLASYHFPPDAAVGGLRAAKFARLLPEFGWQPYVLTARDRLDDQGVDNSRLAGLESVPIVRTGELPRVVEALFRVLGKIRGELPSAAGAAAGGAASPGGAAVTPVSSGPETLKARLTRWLVSLLVLLPDEKKNWALYAAGVAVRLIRRHRIDWVVTSGPPFSGHVIGLAARLLTRAKWVADFRDPWIDMLEDRFPNLRSRLADRIEHWMEAAVVRYADRIAVTTPRMRQAMTARYPQAAEKFLWIPNSIDVDRITTVEPLKKYEPLTITYAGVLYFDRTPEPLFRAVAELLKSGQAAPGDLRIKLVGQCRHIEGVDTMTIASRYGVDEVVELVDRVPYAEAVRIMQRSHVLLMLAPARHRLVVPAKIYDYLGTGSSILAIAEDGATSDLVAETQCGRCFSAEDTAGMAGYLAGLLKGRAYERLANDPRSFARYEARHVTEQLLAGLSNADAVSLHGVMART